MIIMLSVLLRFILPKVSRWDLSAILLMEWNRWLISVWLLIDEISVCCWLINNGHLKKIWALVWRSPHSHYGLVSAKLWLNFWDFKSNPDLRRFINFSCSREILVITDDGETVTKLLSLFKSWVLKFDRRWQLLVVASSLFHISIHVIIVVLRKDCG